MVNGLSSHPYFELGVHVPVAKIQAGKEETMTAEEVGACISVLKEEENTSSFVDEAPLAPVFGFKAQAEAEACAKHKAEAIAGKSKYFLLQLYSWVCC